MASEGRARFIEDDESNENSSIKIKTPRKSRSICKSHSISLSRPLRIFQFLTTLLLLSSVVYMIAMQKKELQDYALILLLILTSSFLFCISIDIYMQFLGDQIPDSPMFLISFLGWNFFLIAGVIILINYAFGLTSWTLILSLGLCFLNSILFMIEILQFIAFWWKKYVCWKKCYPMDSFHGHPTKTIYSKSCKFPSSDTQICRCEMTTSVSGGVCIDPAVDSVVEDHGTRKCSTGHRRQYTDQQSSVPALSIMAVAQVQTDPGASNPVEVQTMKTQLKESLIQTSNQVAHSPADGSRISNPNYYLPVPSMSSPYQSHCASVCQPSVVFVREGSSCCGSCNCGGQHLDKSPQIQYLNQAEDRSGHITPHSAKSTTQWVGTPKVVDTNISEKTENADNNQGRSDRAKKKLFNN